MQHCNIVHENLFAYSEKELPLDLLLQLDTHISECDDCKRVVSEFGSVLALINEQKYIEPRSFAETRIMQGIEYRLEKRQKSASPAFVRILPATILSMGVAGALVIGFFIGSDFAATHSQYSQNNEMIEAVRTDLNIPEFMTDDIFHFTE